MESFFGGGGAAAGAIVLNLGGGGGPQGTAGKLPERPCDRKGNWGGGAEVLVPVSFDVMVVDLDLAEDSSFESPSWTSSNDAVDSRCAVSNGDFGGASPGVGKFASRSRFDVFVPAMEALSIVSVNLDTRGVELEEEDRGRSVRDRVDADGLDGCEAMAGASSKVS